MKYEPQYELITRKSVECLMWVTDLELFSDEDYEVFEEMPPWNGKWEA